MRPPEPCKLLPILLAASVACNLVAQTDTPQLGARSFFPPDYTREIHLDLQALRKTGALELLQGSLVGDLLLHLAGGNYGVPVHSLEDARMAARAADFAVVLRGSDKLQLPKASEFREAVVTGKHPSVLERAAARRRSSIPGVENHRKDRLLALPQPRALVYGNKTWMKRVLTGAAKSGTPHPELMALTADPRSLAHVAGDRGWFSGLLPGRWLHPDDPLQYVAVQLRFDGKPQGFLLQATLRFKTGDKGPDAMLAGLRKDLAAADATMAGPLRKYIDAIKFEKSGTDLTARLAIGKLADTRALLAAADRVPWFGSHWIIRDDYDRARRLAEKTGRALLVNFTSRVCVVCRLVEVKHMREKKVVGSLARGFVEARLNTGRADSFGKRASELQKKMVGKPTLPQFAIVDPKSEKVVRRRAGRVDQAELLKFLGKDRAR